MPNISVIVPVYKVEPFLHRCVDSILSQTYEDFELILVDDGSPDSCGAICDRYALQDSRIHAIHQENGGLSAARNAGIDWVFANSDSQWLAFVDSDDWVHPEFLQQLYTAAAQTGCCISACGFCRTGGEELPEPEDASITCMDANDYYCGEMHESLTAVAWNKLYHRHLFQQLRYPVGKLHEDEFTTYRAVYQAKTIGVTPVPLYAYYQNPEGIMRSSWNPRRMHVLEAFEEQIAFARETNNLRLLCKSVESYLYSTYEQLEKAEETYRKELRVKLRTALKLARECGLDAGIRQRQWAYEAAYPCKPLWWLASRVITEKK